MNRAALLGSLFFLAAANAAPAGAADRASMMEETSRLGFVKAEEIYLAAASDGGERTARALAEFYMANGLWVEALARVKDDATPAGRLLAAECELRMGRDRAVVARLAESAPNDAIAAIALTRLGAYREAREAFQSGRAPDAARNLSDETALAAAETFAATGDADRAAAALSGLSENQEFQTARDYLLGSIRAARGDKAGAIAAYRRSASLSSATSWIFSRRFAFAPPAAARTSGQCGRALPWRSPPMMSARSTPCRCNGAAARLNAIFNYRSAA